MGCVSCVTVWSGQLQLMFTSDVLTSCEIVCDPRWWEGNSPMSHFTVQLCHMPSNIHKLYIRILVLATHKQYAIQYSQTIYTYTSISYTQAICINRLVLVYRSQTVANIQTTDHYTIAWRTAYLTLLVLLVWAASMRNTSSKFRSRLMSTNYTVPHIWLHGYE